MTGFPALVLEALRVKREVQMETASAAGQVHRVPIWIVVVDDAPYVRSVRGAQGRWFRELLERGGSVQVGPRHVRVHATRVASAEINARVSGAIEAKYDRPRASVVAMIRDEVLPTTARLDPA